MTSKKNSENNTNKRDLGTDYEHVNHPPHYQGKIEAITYIEDKLTRDEYIGFLKGSVIKYLSRLGKKESDLDDVKKAIWYLERMSELYNNPIETPSPQKDLAPEKPTGYSLTAEDYKSGGVTLHWADGSKTKGGHSDYQKFWEDNY